MFAERCSWHGASYFMADGHYKLTMYEHLAPTGIPFAEAPTVPAVAYVRVKALMNEGLLRMPNIPKLLRQLREIRSRKLPGGTVQVIKQKWPTGEHGDLADAFVLAVYQAEGVTVPPPPPAQGTKAWEDAQRAERRQNHEIEGGKSWWRKKRR